MMDSLPQICFYCDNLFGCEYLADSKGQFIPERTITVEQPRECPEWLPIEDKQRAIRETMYGIQGEGCIRVLHTVSKIIMEDLNRRVEEGEIDVSEMPDFDGMRVDGMAVADREEQLRYEHDEDGNVIVDEDGRKRPRPSYILRRFACDPNGNIGLDHSVGMGWNNDQVIKFIIDSEVEQGLLERPKKFKGKPRETNAAEAAPKETKQMAGEGRRVLINRGKKGGEAAEEKVASPPRRKGAGKAAAAQEAQAEAPSVETSAAAPFDMKEFIDDIRVAAGEAVAGHVNDKLNEIMSRLDALQQTVVDAVTILHDVLIEAEVLAGADPKIDEAGGILSYLPDPE